MTMNEIVPLLYTSLPGQTAKPVAIGQIVSSGTVRDGLRLNEENYLVCKGWHLQLFLSIQLLTKMCSGRFDIKNSCYSYIQWQFHRRRFQQLYLAQNSDSCMKNKTTPSNKHISLFNNINQLFTYSKGPSLHLRDHTKCFIHQQGPQV